MTDKWRDGRSGGFADRSTPVAYQKCHNCVTVMVVSASDVRTAAINPVDQSLLHQEFECAIDRDGASAGRFSRANSYAIAFHKLLSARSG